MYSYCIGDKLMANKLKTIATEEQKKTYDEHYDKYKEDKNYRVEINKAINKRHEDIGLEAPIANVNAPLSRDKLFDKEGKSYEYKSNRERPKDIGYTTM